MIRFTEAQAKKWLGAKKNNAVKVAMKTKEQQSGRDIVIPKVELQPSIREVIKREHGTVIEKYQRC